MGRIYTSAEQLVGKTPLLSLTHITNELKLGSEILAKLEFLNPAGSAKDRVAMSMIDDAEEKGLINPGAMIIEPTSGNTGIGIAMISAVRGYRAVIVMPDSMSVERIRTMKAYGAEVILTPGALGMKGAIEKAEEIHRENPGSIIAGQFENPANPKAHILTTGPELYEDTDGQIDIFVAGVGTGGTITGCGQYLKERIPGMKVVAVEPATSPLLSKGVAGPHGLQGIGANFVPSILDRDVIDEIITIADEEAYEYGRMLGRTEGILCGITSGAALCAAVKLAKRPENKGKRIVAFLPDSGDRYLTSKMFAE